MSITQTPFLNEPKPKSNVPAVSQNDITALPSTATDTYRSLIAFSEFKNNLASRLLILSCSQRKRAATNRLPALDRYDGPAYQVVRKFLRIYPQEAASLDIYILSAEFGLIAASDMIPNYDRQMNKQRADELRPDVLSALRKISEALMCCTVATDPRALSGCHSRGCIPHACALYSCGIEMPLYLVLIVWLDGSRSTRLELRSSVDVLCLVMRYEVVIWSATVQHTY